MVQICTTVCLILASLSFAITSQVVEYKKVLVIINESLPTAAAVRNITICGPQCKVQIASMAMDFVDAFNYAKYSFNNAIPNLVGDESYSQAVTIAELLGDFVYDIEQALPGNAEALREKIAETLERTYKASDETKNITLTNDFVNNQIKRKHDYLIFAIYHLQLQALHFNKTNKELEPLIESTVNNFVKALKSLPITDEVDKAVEQELRHSLLHQSVITSKIIYKLENWVEVNADGTEDSQIVDDVLQLLGELYDQSIRAASIDNKAQHMKNKLISIYQQSASLISKLVDVKYSGNLGGQEFIRSSIFHSLALGLAYAANIVSVLAK